VEGGGAPAEAASDAVPDGTSPAGRSSPGASGPYPLPESREHLAILFRLTDSLYQTRGIDGIFRAALDAISAALGVERASMLLFDPAGVMRFVAWRGLSEAYRARVEGHSPWRPGDRDPAPIFVEDIEATAEPDWLKATIRAEGIRALSFIPLVARGACIGKFMTYHADPRAFTRAEAELVAHIARRVGFGLERARAEEARELAEAALRETEDRFRLMSENAPVMLWVSKPDGSCQHLNRMLREFWDVEDGALEAFDWSATLHPDDADRVSRTIGGAIAAHEAVTVEARYRNAAGEYRVLQTHARPRFSADGAFAGLIGVNVDTTERKQAEEGRELLLAELSHRVKNMLAVVQGVARQTFRSADSVVEAQASFEGRLIALAHAHDLLTRSAWTSASLEELVRATLPLRDEHPQIAIAGPRVALAPRQTLALAMALHELFTNALKYGALVREEGRIAVGWTLGTAPERQLILEWRETVAADAPPAAPPTREGFGTRLIRQVFTHDLGGTVEFDYAPAGLTCRAVLPLG
jgi:PAS domain S-box-containing protein